MTSKIDMQQVMRALESVRGTPVLTSNQCADLAKALNNAAPEAPRQEPVAAFEVSHGPMGDDGAPIWVRLKDLQDFDIENLADGTKLYLSAPAPLSPDHSGGGAGMVLPERAEKDGGFFSTQLKVNGWNACLDKVKELNQ